MQEKGDLWYEEGQSVKMLIKQKDTVGLGGDKNKSSWATSKWQYMRISERRESLTKHIGKNSKSSQAEIGMTWNVEILRKQMQRRQRDVNGQTINQYKYITSKNMEGRQQILSDGQTTEGGRLELGSVGFQ